jgi:AraC-like DNA-binding protein
MSRRPDTGEDFASAALFALVRTTLVEGGYGVPDAGRGPDGALVPLTSKRDLLAAVAARHGLTPLIEAGRAVPAAPPDPSLAALLAAIDPADLFARWIRLERFLHSRHRVVLHESGANHLVAEHVSLTGEPPHPYEDALILGLLAAATAAVGARGLTVRLGRAANAGVVIRGDTIIEPAPGAAMAVWRFEWTAVEPPQPIPAAGDDDLVSAVRRRIAADPARSWSVAAVADLLGLAPRTLQRRLAPAGGLTAIASGVRAERAADLLINSTHALGIVGFACGYADQPHFTREFQRRTAMTPAAYRRAFASGDPAA